MIVASCVCEGMIGGSDAGSLTVVHELTDEQQMFNSGRKGKVVQQLRVNIEQKGR